MKTRTRRSQRWLLLSLVPRTLFSNPRLGDFSLTAVGHDVTNFLGHNGVFSGRIRSAKTIICKGEHPVSEFIVIECALILSSGRGYACPGRANGQRTFD